MNRSTLLSLPPQPSPSGPDRGQTTAEYALVILGAAAIALLVLAWAAQTGKIATLLNKVIDSVAGNVG